jgi:hypothetical protein
LFTDSKRDHIFVIHKGNYFVFNVLNSNGKNFFSKVFFINQKKILCFLIHITIGSILEPAEILACFDYILNQNHKQPEFNLGSLTSENRDTWAEVRDKLEGLGNQEALNSIDSALFCINLDDIESNDPDQLSNNFLHGNCRNRWFDKNHQLIITK